MDNALKRSLENAVQRHKNMIRIALRGLLEEGEINEDMTIKELLVYLEKGI